MIDRNPEKAIITLNSIGSSSLSEENRHYHDFLSIKSNDKANVLHTSDSLILDVVKWYAVHPQDDIYPETVYYAGRVYSDLGDRPTALGYFREALELPRYFLFSVGYHFNTKKKK